MIDLIKDKLRTHDGINECGLITFINPWSYLVLRNEPNFLNKFDVLYVDGISLVWLLRLLLGIRVGRNSFDMTSMAGEVFEWCVKNELKVAFVGSTQENIEMATINLLDRFPNLNLICVNNGFFSSDAELRAFCARLKSVSPDVIIAGMGTPRQEYFLTTMRDIGWLGKGYTCGGFFHQVAKRVDYYPQAFNAFNLRWLYRIIDEPKLLGRYSKQYPKFFVLFLFDCLKYRISQFSRLIFEAGWLDRND